MTTQSGFENSRSLSSTQERSSTQSNTNTQESSTTSSQRSSFGFRYGATRILPCMLTSLDLNATDAWEVLNTVETPPRWT